MKVSKLHKWSAGLLFLDISSVLYRVLGGRLLRQQWCDGLIVNILTQMRVPAVLFHDILAWCSGDKLLEDMRPHHQQVLRSFFDGSTA